MTYVVPDVVRFSINQSLGSKNVANVLDFEYGDPGPALDRSPGCLAIATILLQAWDSHLRPFCVNNLTCQSVSWVDLDSSSGSTGINQAGAPAVWPAVGGSSADPHPSNVAVLVHKNTLGSQRGQRRGRMYLAGYTEGSNQTDSSQNVNGQVQVDLTAALDGFLEDVTTEVGGFPVLLVVSHVVTRDSNGNPATGTSSAVSSLTVDPVFASQRRRLR